MINAYVPSHIVYMFPFYSQANKTNLSELQIIQNNCIDGTFRLPTDTPSPFLYSCSLVPISLILILKIKVHLHRMLNSFAKHGFFIWLNKDITSRSCRQRSGVHITNDHASLINSISEYNRLSFHIRRFKNMDEVRFNALIVTVVILSFLLPVIRFHIWCNK